MSTHPILLIDYGDLPSLTALALEADTARVILWHAAESDDAGRRRREAVSRHEEAYGVRRLVSAAAPPVGLAEEQPPAEHVTAFARLMHAAVAAVQLGCSRIVWPVQAGPNHTAVGPEVERAQAVAELVAGCWEPGATAEPLVIDLPLVELTERQVVELAEDSSAPLQRTFWPCGLGRTEPCGRCSDCRRWRQAFDQVGLPWPWSRSVVGA